MYGKPGTLDMYDSIPTIGTILFLIRSCRVADLLFRRLDKCGQRYVVKNILSKVIYCHFSSFSDRP